MKQFNQSLRKQKKVIVSQQRDRSSLSVTWNKRHDKKQHCLAFKYCYVVAAVVPSAQLCVELPVRGYWNYFSLVIPVCCGFRVNFLEILSSVSLESVPVFIESRSSQKFQSRSGPRRPLNPDPDPSYFLTISENIIKLFHNYKIFSSQEVHWKI